MKTLDEHNLQRTAFHDANIKVVNPQPNGIECPECGEELWDSSPDATLISNPPQKDIHCPKCLFVGYRIA